MNPVLNVLKPVKPLAANTTPNTEAPTGSSGLPFFPATEAGYRLFLQHLLYHENLAYCFDEPFVNYTNKANEPHYSKTQANVRQRIQGKFESTLPRERLMTIAAEEMEAFYYQGITRKTFKGVSIA